MADGDTCCMRPKGENDARIISRFEKEAELISQLSLLIQDLANEAINKRKIFKIGLSGGSMVTQLSKGLQNVETDWSKWRFFFCDERVVPFNNGDSTYGAYAKAFASVQIPVTEDQFIKIDPTLSVDDAAENYTLLMEEYFPKSEFPQFDLLLLGMGPDGHTCSLFPGHKLCDESKKWVAPISDSPKPPPCRVTLTFPVLNNAHTVIFVITGESKAETVKRILKDGELYPAALVKQKKKKVIWMLDGPASSLL